MLVLVVYILVCDAPSILRVQIVVVVVLAILVPGWVSHQNPGDFHGGDVELLLVYWYFIIRILGIFIVIMEWILVLVL